MFSGFYESDESKPAGGAEPEATVDVVSAPADPAPAAHHHKHHHHKHRHKSKEAANPASGNAADVESAAPAPDADASRPVLLSKQSVRFDILEEMKEERLAARRRANELDETVRSWGFDPRTNLGTAAKSLLKTTDQATPMMMRKYTRQRGFCLSLLIMFCMAAAFAGGFIVVARQLVTCNTHNECETCALSVVDLEKEADDENIKCSQLSQPSLTINAGCLSIAIDGKDGHDKFSKIFQYGREHPVSYESISNFYSGDISESEHEAALDAFAQSYQANVDLWFDCFEEKTNKYGQLVDPDVSCVQKWSRKNWAGYSDIYDLLRNTDDDPQDDDLNEQWIAYAIKVIYGGISTTCALYTSQPHSSRKILKADITYLELEFCACNVQCPGDGVLATTAIEAAEEGSEGLGEVALAIPVHYIVQSREEYEDFGGDAILTGEMVKASDYEHCLSATVRTDAPASFLDTVYECCTKKSTVEILSSSYAFGGFMLSGAIFALAFFVIPLEFATFEREGSLEDAARLMADHAADS